MAADNLFPTQCGAQYCKCNASPFSLSPPMSCIGYARLEIACQLRPRATSPFMGLDQYSGQACTAFCIQLCSSSYFAAMRRQDWLRRAYNCLLSFHSAGSGEFRRLYATPECTRMAQSGGARTRSPIVCDDPLLTLSTL